MIWAAAAALKAQRTGCWIMVWMPSRVWPACIKSGSAAEQKLNVVLRSPGPRVLAEPRGIRTSPMATSPILGLPHPPSCTWTRGGCLVFWPLLFFFLSEDKSGGCPQGSESVVQRNGEWHPLLPQWNFEWRIDQANSYHCGNHDVSSLCERINLL